MAKKKESNKITEVEEVSQYMKTLVHPMKEEIEQLRIAIKKANIKLQERIKWNAPSYYYMEDILTFGPLQRKDSTLMLIFHHPLIVTIPSPILEGTYKDRRIVSFRNKMDVTNKIKEIQQIINTLIVQIDASKN